MELAAFLGRVRSARGLATGGPGLTQPQRSEELEQLRPKLMGFFRWNRAESPKDETQETMSRAVERMNDPGTEIRVPLQAYVFGIARNVLRESRRGRRETPTDPAGVEFTNLTADSSLTVDDKILVEECLSRLSPEDGSLVIEYHRKGAEQLAKELGISPNAVRIRVHRIHRKVQETMTKKTPDQDS